MRFVVWNSCSDRVEADRVYCALELDRGMAFVSMSTRHCSCSEISAIVDFRTPQSSLDSRDFVVVPRRSEGSRLAFVADKGELQLTQVFSSSV